MVDKCRKGFVPCCVVNTNKNVDFYKSENYTQECPVFHPLNAGEMPFSSKITAIHNTCVLQGEKKNSVEPTDSFLTTSLPCLKILVWDV